MTLITHHYTMLNHSLAVRLSTRIDGLFWLITLIVPAPAIPAKSNAQVSVMLFSVLHGFRIVDYDEPRMVVEYEARIMRVTKGGFFGQNEIKGLALPKDVLEKIYYKNAMRIYPGVRQSLQQLGYSVE